MRTFNIEGQKGKIVQYYGLAIDIIIMILILVMLVTLFVALGSVIVELYQALTNLRHDMAIQTLVTSILSVFVLIELFRSFTDYLEYHRIRLRIVAEVAIVFILRDIFIGLYNHQLAWQDIIALAILVAVLVGARLVAIKYSPANSNE
jgi:uncharacterized membrane protein (DUF373 family)